MMHNNDDYEREFYGNVLYLPAHTETNSPDDAADTHDNTKYYNSHV